MLIFINLWGVALEAGPGEGVRYFKELRFNYKHKNIPLEKSDYCPENLDQKSLSNVIEIMSELKLINLRNEVLLKVLPLKI